MAFSDDVYLLLAERKRQLTILSADFTDWTSSASINGNVYLIALVLGIVSGMILLSVGLLKNKKSGSFKGKTRS